MSRILHITEAGGGVVEVIKNIALVDETNHHSLLVRRRDFSSNSLESIPDSLQVHFWKGNLLKAYVEFLKLSRQVDFDIVHFHSSRAGGLRLIFRGVKKAYSPHCFAFERQDINRFYRKVYETLERNLIRHTDGFLAVNNLESRWAFENNPKIVLSQYEYVTERKSRKVIGNCVVAVGRICVQKNPIRFIEIINSLRQETKYLEVIWIGEGDKVLTKILRNNNITVTGWIDSEGVSEHLERASILLHTAMWEGMPIVFYEAWSYGVPVFAFSASYLEGISRVNVFHSDKEAVKQILTELREPEMNQSFAVDKRIAVEKLCKFYTEILNSRV